MASQSYKELFFPSSIVRRIDRGEIRPYRDFAGVPSVELSAPDKEGMPKLVAPIESRDVKAWLADFYWQTRETVPKADEIDLAVKILHNRSLHRTAGCDALAIEQELQKNPLAAVLTEYWDCDLATPLDGRAKVVYESLRTVAENKFLLTLKGVPFPAGPSSLVRQLNLHRVFLESLGIEFAVRRSNGSHLRIWRVDDDRGSPSVEPSAPSTRNTDEPEAMDDWTIDHHTATETEPPDPPQAMDDLDDEDGVASINASCRDGEKPADPQVADDRTIANPLPKAAVSEPGVSAKLNEVSDA